MRKINISNEPQELIDLCKIIRGFVDQSRYVESEFLIKEAMGKYPHAAQPHNLFGLVLEKKGDHWTAMKHFRAAWALDPNYAPASHNMDCFANFCPKGPGAFDVSDCVNENYTDIYRIG